MRYAPEQAIPRTVVLLPGITEAIGANLIGLLLAVFILGITTVQTTLYFQRFQDSRITKCTVLLVVIFQIIGVSVLAQRTYEGLITDRGDFLLLPSLLDSRATLYIVAVVQSGLVQVFFVYRIWTLSRNWWQTVLPGLTVATQIGFGSALTIEWLMGFDQVQNPFRTKAIFTAWIICEIVADFSIAVMMSFYLLTLKAGWHRTNTMLNKLVVHTVSTGLITGIFSTVCIFAVVTSNVSTLLILAAPYGGSFSLAMLANLHSRTHIRKWNSTLNSPEDGNTLELRRRPPPPPVLSARISTNMDNSLPGVVISVTQDRFEHTTHEEGGTSRRGSVDDTLRKQSSLHDIEELDESRSALSVTPPHLVNHRSLGFVNRSKVQCT